MARRNYGRLINIGKQITPAPSVIDTPNYNIFTDPDLATRSQDFLSKYINQLEDDDWGSFAQLGYHEHGEMLTDEDFRRAVLSDKELYDSVDLSGLKIGKHGITAEYNGKKIDINVLLDKLSEEDRKKYDGFTNKARPNYKHAKKILEEAVGSMDPNSFIFDRNTGGVFAVDKMDDTMKSSYFNKAVDAAGGVKGLYNRSGATSPFKKSIESAMQKGTGYKEYLDSVASSGKDIMSEYEDVLTQTDGMFTNTLDTATWQGQLGDEEPRWGIY